MQFPSRVFIRVVHVIPRISQNMNFIPAVTHFTTVEGKLENMTGNELYLHYLCKANIVVQKVAVLPSKSFQG